jgi:protein-S-isoprenylcysteine O-methyltransferase Ste14
MVRALAGIGALAFTIVVLDGLRRASLHPKGRAAGNVTMLQRGLSTLALAPMSALALAVGWLLWRPIRLPLRPSARAAALALGSIFYFSGLALMVWGRRTLGDMYNVSTSLGAELYADHRLITSGPFSLVRNPMYLGGILWEVGALLIFRTWTTLLIAVNAPMLLLRARREEQALAAEFGERWVEYSRRVPLIFPRLR